jgi:hypothetical protein
MSLPPFFMFVINGKPYKNGKVNLVNFQTLFKMLKRPFKVVEK